MNDAFDNARTDREALERYGETLTHAVTVPQPLAWAIASGHCPIIPADTRPDMGREGELLGIHARGSYFTPRALDDLEVQLGRLLTADEERAAGVRGALIGVARLVGVVRESREYPGQFVRYVGRGAIVDPCDMATNERIRPWWRPGTKWGLYLEPESAVLLPEPIPMRGSGGVWRIPNAVLHPPGATLTGWALEQWRKARER